MGDVPVTIDAQLHGWLAGALAQHGTLVESDVSVIGAGEGFVGQLGRVALRWEDAGETAPASVIVKLPTADPGGRAVGQMMGLYERESRFYDELADTIGIRVPHCHVNIADPATDTWALVLEDLAPMVPGDQVAGADPARARIVVERLAHLHARFYGGSEVRDLTWIPSLEGPLTDAIVPMFEGSWAAFVDHYGADVPRRALDWVERFAPQVPAFIERFTDTPMTVCHGDFRLDNMFFGSDGAFALIDWQMAMRVPGSSDLVYFLVTNLPPQVRRTYEWELIDRYIDTLRHLGVGEDLLPRELVVDGYRQGVLLFGVMFVSTMTMDRANERGAAFFDALVGRTMAAIDDLESGLALGL